MASWLVTGGAGYVGSHVARAMAEAGMNVVVLDDLSTGRREFAPEGIPLVEAPIGDAGAVARALSEHGVRGVMHLAALKYAGVSVERPLEFWERNVSQLERLLAAVGERGIDTFVFSSTCAVYGTPAAGVVTEESPIAPESPYGETKIAGEWMVSAAAGIDGFRHTSLRYFNVAGSAPGGAPDTSPHNLFPLVIAALREGRAPHVNGTDYPTPDGSCVRDYVHVSDIAGAHVLAAKALEEGRTLRPVYNVGTESGSSVLEVVRRFLELTGSELEPEIRARRAGDPARVLASAALAREELGWSPEHDLDAMVRSAWDAAERMPEVLGPA